LNEPDIVKQWWQQGFTVIQAQEWADSLGRGFNPEHDMAFCTWLRDNKQLNPSPWPSHDLDSLRSEYQTWLTAYTQGLAAVPEDWIQINSKFADKPWYRVEQTYQQLWISQELTPAQAQSALSQGFTLDDFMFLVWLRDNKGLKIEQIKTSAIKILRKKYQAVWTQLDSQFTRKAEDGKTYQQIWESHGLNYHQASVWVKLSGVGDNYCWPWEWMQQGFTWQTTSVWLAAGLTTRDYELATYAHWKDYQPNSDSVQKIKKTGILAQEWLDCFYPTETRNTITKLDIHSKNLTEALDCSDFVNLTRLDCYGNKITSLNLVNCQQLKIFWGHDNLLTDLVLPTSAEQLTNLSLSRNSFPTQQLTQFSHLVNCEYLDISNNPWTGSLVPLSNLTKLKELRIDNSELTELDLDSLPSGLTSLDIGNNPNLVSPDLTAGTQLVNLKTLECRGTKLATRLEVYGQPSEYNNYIHLLKKAQQTYLQNQIEVPLQNN
jgi:hypothetical protein